MARRGRPQSQLNVAISQKINELELGECAMFEIKHQARIRFIVYRYFKAEMLEKNHKHRILFFEDTIFVIRVK